MTRDQVMNIVNFLARVKATPDMKGHIVNSVKAIFADNSAEAQRFATAITEAINQSVTMVINEGTAPASVYQPPVLPGQPAAPRQQTPASATPDFIRDRAASIL